MVVISVLCAYVAPQASTESSVTEGIEMPAANPKALPGFGASQQKEEAAPAATEAPAQDAPAPQPAK
jgi:preprotein translocase subunit SecG